ncbi:hypothetical protein PFLUV_G00212790 [Perca fluviatilis]|uniref:Uncharacterized protein n=1 Tax=Perca fluviatilis TaxID=8168 RepID=A0A6A5EKX4_PERFL|nr:hypothetical protein PFLUV_G00212790 [Perca fluviatilis]
MSLQCLPSGRRTVSHQSAAAYRGGSLSSTRNSSARSCTGPDLTIVPSLSAAFDGQICFVCSSKEEETGEISVLLFGSQGEEPVVDSTLQREGAAQRG